MALNLPNTLPEAAIHKHSVSSNWHLLPYPKLTQRKRAALMSSFSPLMAPLRRNKTHHEKSPVRQLFVSHIAIVPNIIHEKQPIGTPMVHHTSAPDTVRFERDQSSSTMVSLPNIISERRPTLKPTGSFWVMSRGQAGTASADASQLANSQIGIRTLIPILGDNRKLAISANLRISAPLNSQGQELGVGVLLSSHLGGQPVGLIVERRQSLDHSERPSVAVVATTGISDVPLGKHFGIDGYVQAGGVKGRTTIGFIGGQASLERKWRTNKVDVGTGVGLWGDVQGRTRRLDVGPQISLFNRHGSIPMRLSAQWRFRIAGDAKPDSGPAIVVAADF
jgi:hypothetical protein